VRNFNSFNLPAHFDVRGYALQCAGVVIPTGTCCLKPSYPKLVVFLIRRRLGWGDFKSKSARREQMNYKRIAVECCMRFVETILELLL